MTTNGSPGRGRAGFLEPADEDPRERRRPAFFVTALVSLCVGLAILVMVLAIRNRDLQGLVGALQRARTQGESSLLVEGAPLPELRLLDTAGIQFEVNSTRGEAGTLLFVSSSACDSCQEVRTTWEAVALSESGSLVHTIEFVVDGTVASARSLETIYPIAVPGHDGSWLLQELAGVPASILMDRSGVVQRVLYGEQQTHLPQAVEELVDRSR